MEVIKINNASISRVAKILKRSGVIVYPTDTAYALGGRFDSPKVISRILAIKKRKDEKFTLVASSLYQVQKFFKLSRRQKQLIKKFWPGPLSLVISSRFAIRVPAHSLARRLCRLAEKPLIATSANLSGNLTPYQIKTIIEQFKNKKNQPDLIIDAGRLPSKKTSTIVQVLAGEIKILRQGAVKILKKN